MDITNTNESFIGKNFLFVSEPIKDFSGNIVAYAIVGESFESVYGALEQSKGVIIQQIIMVLISLL